MSELRTISFAFAISDPENWNEEDVVAADEDDNSETYSDWVVNFIMENLSLKLQEIIDSNPTLFVTKDYATS